MIEITVMDEDKDHKYEFLGKVLVPLLYCTVLYCTVLYRCWSPCSGSGTGSAAGSSSRTKP